MLVTLIEDASALREAAATLSTAERIACDVEADGLFRYRAKVCVLQLSTPEHTFVIDAQAVWDVDVLQPLLGSQGPLKVIHDIAFDARLLREAGVRLGNVQDTAIAARFLGEKSIGLGSLLGSRLGITVDKDRQKHDWSKRPLTDEDLDYLVGDVRHLFALAELLATETQTRGIAEEVRVETEYCLGRALATPPTDPTPAWAKVKGAREQSPLCRSVLRELLAVRDEVAQRRDVPPFKVAPEDALVRAAIQRPTSAGELVRIGLRGPYAKAAMNRWLDAIRSGTRRGDVPPEEQLPPEEAGPTREQRARWKARESALKKWRAEQAAARGQDPQVILPGHCLSDLVQLDSDDAAAIAGVPGIGAVRIERDGAALRGVLAGA